MSHGMLAETLFDTKEAPQASFLRNSRRFGGAFRGDLSDIALNDVHQCSALRRPAIDQTARLQNLCQP
jgi:hypothetical protein